MRISSGFLGIFINYTMKTRKGQKCPTFAPLLLHKIVVHPTQSEEMSERKREKFRRKTDLEEEGKGEGGGKGIEFLDILFQEWGIELLGKE